MPNAPGGSGVTNSQGDGWEVRSHYGGMSMTFTCRPYCYVPNRHCLSFIFDVFFAGRSLNRHAVRKPEHFYFLFQNVTPV